MKFSTQFMFTALLGLAAFASADEDIILKPLDSTKGMPTKLLVFIPGGNVPNNNYTLTAQAIQRYTQLNLWVVIPAVFNRLCIIECTATFVCAPLYNTVNGAVAKAVAAGMPKDTEQHLAGHSLGGTCANYLVQAYPPDTYKSLTIMGSYVDETGKGTLPNYPIPVATIGAELDGGMARPGKLALWVQQHMQYSQTTGSEDKALSTKPVVIINSIDHSDFCPGFSVPGDLPSELDQSEASKLVGQVAGAFLNLQVLPSSSSSAQNSLMLLKQKWADTQTLVSPIIKSLALEVEGGNGMFAPGSYSPWCKTAQLQLAGVSEADQAKISFLANVYATADTSFEHTRVYYETAGGKLLLNISGHASYYTDIQNTGTFIAAQEIGCKLANWDRIAQQLNTTTTSKTLQCRDVNEKALDVALSLAAPQTLDRYKKSGRGVCFSDDTTVAGNIGPLFIKSRLKMNADAKCVHVQSLKLQTFIDGSIHPGVHYCKLLSPARILDWIMTDSLKKN
jgi:hypothetical protein